MEKDGSRGQPFVRPLGFVLLMLVLGGCTTPAGEPVGAPTTPAIELDPEECASLSLAVDHDAIVLGDSMNVTLRLTNCGTRVLLIGRSDLCGSGPALVVEDGWGRYSAYPGALPHRRLHTMSMGGCVTEFMDPIFRTNLSPGDVDVLRFPWNGTLVDHDLCYAPPSNVTPQGGLLGCERKHDARLADHRLSVSWRNATANATFTLLPPPEATFQQAFTNASQDPALPLRFDPSRPMRLVRDANGTLVRSASPFLCEDTENATCFGQPDRMILSSHPRPSVRLDSDGDRILDAFEAHLADLAPNDRAFAIVGTDRSSTWDEIRAHRDAVGWFPVNEVWIEGGFAADLTRAQVEAIAAHDDVRVVEGVLIRPT